MKKLSLSVIRIDGGTQPRERINMEAVGDYAEAIKVGIEFPPVVVFHDGAEYWLADGFHRYHAHKQAGKASIEADIRPGTLLDAKLVAVGANVSHGLRRTNEDKRRAVQMVLDEPAWKAWSDRKIAEACGVSDKTVAAVRAAIFGNSEDAPAVRKVERAGKTYQQDTAKIGKTKPAGKVESDSTRGAVATLRQAPEREPSAPKRQIEAIPAEAGPSDFDPVAELERAHAEITKLTAEIEAAEADDAKAEAIKWRRSYEHAQRQQSEAMDRAKQATDREAWTMRQLRRCGRAIGQDDPSKIAPAIEAFVREHRKEVA